MSPLLLARHPFAGKSSVRAVKYVQVMSEVQPEVDTVTTSADVLKTDPPILHASQINYCGFIHLLPEETFNIVRLTGILCKYRLYVFIQ